MFNTYYESERSFHRAVEEYFLENYESNSSVDPAHIIDDLHNCNSEQLIEQIRQFGHFDICMRSYMTTLTLGGGALDLKIVDPLDRTFRLSSNAVFGGAQILYPYEFGSKYIFEVRYWSLPSLQDKLNIVDSLKDESYLSFSAYGQKRISKSSFSTRVGLSVANTPYVQENSGTNIISTLDLQYRSLLLTSLNLGFKYSPFRHSGKNHYVFTDFGVIPYSDNQFLNKFTKSYILRGGLRYNLTKFLGINLEVEKMQYYSRSDAKIKSFIWASGIQVSFF